MLLQYDNIFQDIMRQHFEQLYQRIDTDFKVTLDAMLTIAEQKVKKFMLMADRLLEKEEKRMLTVLILTSMLQSFSLGYGIGKIEGQINQKVFL